jgi:DNA excision repair protein ERCC-2
VASFCGTCGGLLHPTAGCRKCSGAPRSAAPGGGAAFSGRRATFQRSGQPLRAEAQARLDFGAPRGPPRPRAAAAELAPRAATRWVPQVAGTPHDELGLFPFDLIREGQRALARDVARTVARGGLLVAHAPTGIGKTAAAVAPALEHALSSGKKVLVLTSKQSQHRIFVETLRRIVTNRGARFAAVDVISKRDMCPRPEKEEVPAFAFMDLCARLCRTKQCGYFIADGADAVQEAKNGIHHVEELVDISLMHGCCPHKIAMEAARTADVVVCDYNYLFSDMRERILESFQVAPQDLVVIIDEAHNLPDRVRANFSLDLTPFTVSEAEAEARRAGNMKAAHWCRLLQEHVDALAKAAGEGSEVVLSKRELLEPVEEKAREATLTGEGLDASAATQGLAEIAEELTKGGEAVARSGQLAEFLAAWLAGGHAYGRILRVEEAGNWRLVHTLLDPGVVAGPILKDLHAAVAMSGTLHPPEMYRDLLGMDVERTRVRTYPSPYDPANRPVLCVKGTTSKYSERGPAMDAKMARIIVDVHRAAPHNTAVFANSYDQVQRLSDAVAAIAPEIERIVETRGMGKQERDRVLDVLEGARGRGGALLMGVLGGSLSEGVDYRDNLLGAVTIAGLPLAPPSREVELLIAHHDRKFPGRGRDYAYELPAVSRVLQAAGRAIRGESDRAAVLLLDERFAWNRYARGFPDDFRPRLVADPMEALAGFYR